VIVLDASAVVALLLNGSAGRRVAEAIVLPSLSLHAPELLDIEVLQALRRYVRTGELTAERGGICVEALGQLDILRYGHADFAARVWALRENLTAYDAAYIALAEALDAPLLTLDARLATAPGHQAEVHLIQQSDKPSRAR
jgi:predicted nucleic acid-binding protein